MDDLEDIPSKVAKDIMRQAKLGFNIEAERRIINILIIYKDTKTELEKLQNEQVEYEHSRKPKRNASHWAD